jgi:integrase/recombinase XerD
LEVLLATPRVTETRFFWSGHGDRKTAVCDWQAKMKRAFDEAKIVKGVSNMMSHRLRDTFAVELLQAGVSIETVSILLGHSSIRITERHYNPWVKARQQRLEADVERAWKDDPFLDSENIRTISVHFAKGPVN